MTSKKVKKLNIEIWNHLKLVQNKVRGNVSQQARVDKPMPGIYDFDS